MSLESSDDVKTNRISQSLIFANVENIENSERCFGSQLIALQCELQNIILDQAAPLGPAINSALLKILTCS